jgi:hypothetical protein
VVPDQERPIDDLDLNSTACRSGFHPWASSGVSSIFVVVTLSDLEAGDRAEAMEQKHVVVAAV